MPFIHWVNCRSASRRAVKRILMCHHPVIGLAFKHYNVDGKDSIVLAQVSTWNQQVFLFDLRTDKEIMFEGELWRILESNQLLKVCHDCRLASRTLKKQFGITLRNVFDTQAAYCVMLMERNLPARQVLLDELHIKFGEDPDSSITPKLELSVSTAGFFWSQRPLAPDKINACAADVVALVPGLYENLNMLLNEEARKMTSELSETYLRGKVLSIVHEDKSFIEVTATDKLRKSGPVTLSDEQHLFLNKTIPKAAASM